MQNPDKHRDTIFVNKPTIYITNRGYHDYSPLEKMGIVIEITKGHVDYRKTDRLRALIRDRLDDMQSDDLICVSGSAIITLEVTAVVMAKFGQVNYLYYEPYYNGYVKRVTHGTSADIRSDDLGDDSPDYSKDEE